jgi:hypothetical protein
MIQKQHLQNAVETCNVIINGVPHKFTFFKSTEWNTLKSSTCMTEVLKKHMVQALETNVGGIQRSHD